MDLLLLAILSQYIKNIILVGTVCYSLKSLNYIPANNSVLKVNNANQYKVFQAVSIVIPAL